MPLRRTARLPWRRPCFPWIGQKPRSQPTQDKRRPPEFSFACSFHFRLRRGRLQPRSRRPALQVAPQSLLALDRFEEGLEVSLSETAAPLPLDYLVKQCGAIFN